MTKTNELLLKLKYKRLDTTILFRIYKPVFNLTTNKIETEPKLVNSLVLKSLNKKILKFFIICGVYFDPSIEGVFLCHNNDFLPDIELDIEFSKLNSVVSKWAKTTYRIIKKYVDVQMKNQFFIRYIKHINTLSECQMYKSASPKQLLGNALAYFNRQGLNISNDQFISNSLEQCSKLATKHSNWTIEQQILDLLLECRNAASKIYYLDLQDLLLNEHFLNDFSIDSPKKT